MLRSLFIPLSLLSAVIFYVVLLTLYTDNFSNDRESDIPTITVQVGGGIPEMRFWKKTVSLFETENPDIKIRLNFTPGDYGRKMKLLIASGTPPDISILYERYFNEYHEYAVLEDLTDYAGSEKYPADLSEYRELAINAFSKNNRLYGMPLYEGTYMVVLNKKHFKKAGLDIPTDGWTYEEFIKKYGRALTIDTDGDGRIDQYAMNPISNWRYFMPLVYATGDLKILSKDGSQWLMDNPKGWWAWNEFGKLVTSYKMAPGRAAQVANDYGLIGFIVQRYSMAMNGPWNISQFLDVPSLDFEVVMPPGGQGRIPKTAFVCGALVMFKASRYKEAAWRFIRFCTNDPRAQLLSLGHRIPTMKSVKEMVKKNDLSLIKDEDTRKEYARYLPHLKKFIIPDENLYFLNFTKEQTTLTRIIRHEFSDLQRGIIDGRTFLGRVTNRIIEDGIFYEQHKDQKVNKKFFAR